MDIWNRPATQSPGVGLLTGKFPRVILSAEAAMRMEALVQCCNIEISWLATVDRDDNDFLIDNIIVPPQSCSMGGTVFRESNMMAMFMGPDGKIPREALSIINRLRAWGHSHHNMGVFASGTDDHQSRAFLEQIPDYFVRLICNKAGDMNVTLYLIDQGLVLYHPKLINRKPTVAEREEHFANELYPFDEWAMDEITEKVAQSAVRLHGDDFTAADLVDFGLGRDNPEHNFGDGA